MTIKNRTVVDLGYVVAIIENVKGVLTKDAVSGLFVRTWPDQGKAKNSPGAKENLASVPTTIQILEPAGDGSPSQCIFLNGIEPILALRDALNKAFEGIEIEESKE